MMRKAATQKSFRAPTDLDAETSGSQQTLTSHFLSKIQGEKHEHA